MSDLVNKPDPDLQGGELPTFRFALESRGLRGGTERENHTTTQDAPREEVRTWLPILLAGISGFVDAVCYLVFFQTFVAHLSGDSIAFGIHIGEGNWSGAFHRAFPIPLFVLGSLLGTVVAESLSRRRIRSIFAIPLCLEILLLLLFLILGTFAFENTRFQPGSAVRLYAILAFPAVAMGVQAALLWRSVGTMIRTTFITGILVSLTEEIVKYYFWLRDEKHPEGSTFLSRVSPSKPSARRMLLLSGIWTTYVLGALCGTLGKIQWGLLSLVVPIGGLVVASALELAYPVMPPE